jgi:heterodisulfide reductase subunit C
VRGYRGLMSEFGRTGSLRALALQVRVGGRHVMRQWLRRRSDVDSEALFLENYAADGLRRPRPELRDLQQLAQACLACGLCSGACAQAGGRPGLDPRDAVLAGVRLEIDVRRLGLDPVGGACAACRACEPVCPVQIPIARVQIALATLGD